ncbi:MAG: 4-hydroxy-3-methylbut-2-enyl diphosphate reductase [Bacteroidales bacterium]|jgi:4-hydroxy-3-methylbut-2-enyl diphosphate reductase|nr:4-hydroxy-3-methylbut-2-enyl diphosphate reductase [Bacteroidales bacterium]
MIVETDIKSGFCFGVQNAVEIAEKALLSGERVYSLGPIVHNDMEVRRLGSLGLVTIDNEQFKKLSNCKVLIRAHGEPPETYRQAEENNIEIIEATCPIVRRLQIRIRESWMRQKAAGGQLVIFGKPGHAEVRGLMGQIDNEGIIISSVSETSLIDPVRPVSLFSQTTMSRAEYAAIAADIQRRMKEAGVEDPDNLLDVHRTICGQVANREPHLREFASRHDVIIFVSGRESSNGKHLYNVCREVNPNTHFISSKEELDLSWFEGKKSAGICGATSTPGWLIMDISKAVETI